MLDHWNKYEDLFMKLESPLSVPFFHSIVLFFFRFYPQMKEEVSTFCSTLYERNILTAKFFLDWYRSSDTKLFGFEDP